MRTLFAIALSALLAPAGALAAGPAGIPVMALVRILQVLLQVLGDPLGQVVGGADHYAVGGITHQCHPAEFFGSDQNREAVFSFGIETLMKFVDDFFGAIADEFGSSTAIINFQIGKCGRTG